MQPSYWQWNTWSFCFGISNWCKQRQIISEHKGPFSMNYVGTRMLWLWYQSAVWVTKNWAEICKWTVKCFISFQFWVDWLIQNENVVIRHGNSRWDSTLQHSNENNKIRIINPRDRLINCYCISESRFDMSDSRRILRLITLAKSRCLVLNNRNETNIDW